MDARERLARDMAYSFRHQNDVSRDADEYWQNTGSEGQAKWLTAADVALMRLEGLSVRRSIEVCLSRLKMDHATARTLNHHLARSIAQEPPVPFGDVDRLRAALHGVEDMTCDVHEGYSKRALRDRLKMIREHAKESL